MQPKSYPGAQKDVIKNIHLSFFYGAKIGILGLNGSGKSSLLKIIAGVDNNFRGDVTFNQIQGSKVKCPLPMNIQIPFICTF